MTYERLGQSLPPSYTRLVWAQMCMRVAYDRFGVPAITFDEHEADPARTERLLAGWLRGAGDDRVSAGLGFERAKVDSRAGEREAHASMDGASESLSAQNLVAVAEEVPCKGEDTFREVFYSKVGGYSQQIRAERHEWLERLKPCRTIGVEQASVHAFKGQNTFVSVSMQATKKLVSLAEQAVSEAGSGTRITFEVPNRFQHWLGRRGFKMKQVVQHGDGLTVFMYKGRRGMRQSSLHLNHAQCSLYMDPRDVQGWSVADADKRARAWQPVWWDPSFWEGKGLPEEVEKVMTQGAEVEMERAVGSRQVHQYPYLTPEAMMEASVEADRAICARTSRVAGGVDS